MPNKKVSPTEIIRIAHVLKGGLVLCLVWDNIFKTIYTASEPTWNCNAVTLRPFSHCGSFSNVMPDPISEAAQIPELFWELEEYSAKDFHELKKTISKNYMSLLGPFIVKIIYEKISTFHKTMENL